MFEKPKFSGVYWSFNSFISGEYKAGLIFTLLFPKFSVVLNFSGFQPEKCQWKETLGKNAFTIKLVDSCFKQCLDKRLTGKPVKLTVEKKDSVIFLLYLGECHLSLMNSLSKNLPFCKIRVVFKSPTANHQLYLNDIWYCYSYCINVTIVI